MRPVPSVIAALMVVVAIAIGTTSAAQAEPIFKAATYPVKVEFSGGAGKLLAGSNEIECGSSNTGSGEVTSPGNLGLATLVFLGCQSAGAKCKSDQTISEGGNSEESKEAGEIRVVAEFHVVLLSSGPGMSSLQLYYLFFLIVLIEVLCSVILIRVVGDPVGNGGILFLLTGEEGVKTGKMSFEGKAVEGKQEVTTCEEPAELCGKEAIELLTEFVEGKPEPTAFEQTDSIAFSPEGTLEG